MSAYRVRVTINGVVWGDVTQGDAPDYGVALPLTFGWRTPEPSAGFPNQPEPGTATIRLISDDPAAVDSLDMGQPVWVEFWADADDTHPYAEFTGRILEVTATAHALGMLVVVQAVDYLRDLANLIVGAVDWPVETYTTRLDRICTEAGITFEGLPPLPTANMSFRSASPVNALQALTELFEVGIEDDTANLFHGIVGANIANATGQPGAPKWEMWSVASVHTTSSEVPGHMVPYEVEWTRTSRNRPDHVTLILPGSSIPPTEVIDTGTRLVAHPPVNVDIFPWDPLVDWLLNQPGDPFGWQVDTIRVLADRDPSVGTWWFPRNTGSGRTREYAGLGARVELTDMDARWVPRNSAHPDGRVAGRLASADLTVDAEGWFIDITLRNLVYLP